MRCSPPAGDHAEVDVVVRDSCLVRDQHDVGGLHQLEATGHGHTFDNCDNRHLRAGDRLTGGFERGEQRPQLGGAFGTQPLDFVEIASGAEIPAGPPADHDDIDVLAVAELVDRALQRMAERDVDRVHPIRPIQRNAPDTAFDIGENRFHMYLPPPTSITVPVM